VRLALLLTGAALACAACSAGPTERPTSTTPDTTTAPAPSAPATPAATPSPATVRDAADTVHDAVTTTRATGKHIEQDIELETDGKTMSLSVTGDFDFAADRGRLAVDLPGGAIDHIDEIFTDGHVYVSEAANAPGRWIRLDRDTAKAHYWLRAPANDPEHVLEQIAGIDTPEVVGTETLDGTPTTHYQGELPHDALLLRGTDKLRTSTQKLDDALAPDTLHIAAHLWIDNRGHIARTRLVLDLDELTSTTTTTFTTPRTPIDTTTPDPQDVSPTNEMTGILIG